MKDEILGYKFIPYEELTDEHCKIALWDSKADFLKSVGMENDDPYLEGTSFPISIEEPGAEEIWKEISSDLSLMPMFIFGIRYSRLNLCENIQEYFKELNFHTEEELQKAFEKAGLTYVEREDD